MEQDMYNNYGRKTQYPAIQQQQPQWQNQNTKKYRYHDVPSYTSEQQQQQQPHMTNNNIGTKTKKNNNDTIKNDFIQPKRFDLVTWFKRRPKVVMVISYMCIFMVGITVGFIPYIKVYMDDCKADRKVIEEVLVLFRRLNSTATPKTASVYGGLPYSYIESLNPRKAIGRGNEDIELTCTGNINILSVKYHGVTGNTESLLKVRELCDKQIQDVQIEKRCLVSLKRVYGVPYPEETVTEIYYKCL